MFDLENWFPKSVFVFCLLSFVLWLSCGKNSTSPQTVTFSGKVTLEGETDHSGVTVSLYKPVELDTALVRINRQYPNIGVQISQETEFDHREHTPVYSTTTDANGNWKIENVIDGVYHAVAEKDSFGWKYIYNCEKAVNFGTLKKGIYISGTIQNNIELKNGQFLYIENNAYLPKENYIKFDDGNVILLEENKNIEVVGDIIKKDHYILTITSKNIHNPGRGIIFNGANKNFRLSKSYFSYLKSAIIAEPNEGFNLEITNSYFRKTENSILAKNKDLLVTNCIYKEIKYNALEVLTIFTIENSIFFNNARVFLNDVEGTLKNNYFLKNEIALIPLEGDTSTSIINNVFEDNNIAIALNSAKCTIKLCDFIVNRLDLECNKNYVQQFFSFTEPNILYNNFFYSDTVISIYGRNSLSGVPYNGNGVNKNIELPFCFWGTTDSTEINIRIFDKKDNPNNIYHYVKYKPYMEMVVETAGIERY